MDEWLLALLGVHHSRCALNTLPLLHRDLFSIEDHQLDESLDHDHAVVGLSCNRVVNQRQVKKVGQLGQLLDLEQLLDPIVGDVESLQLLKLLDISQRPKPVLVQL